MAKMAAYMQQLGRQIQDLTIKVQVGDDTRLVPVNPNGTHEELVAKTRQTFPESFISDKQVFKYEDAGGDTITVYDTQSLFHARRGTRNLKLSASGNSLNADRVQDIRKQLLGLKEYVCGEVDRLLQLLDGNDALNPEAVVPSEAPAMFAFMEGANVATPAAGPTRPAWHTSSDINDGVHKLHQTTCGQPDLKQASELHTRYMKTIIEPALKRLGRYTRLDLVGYCFQPADQLIQQYDVMVVMKGHELQATSITPGYVTLQPLQGREKDPQFQDVVDVNWQLSGDRLSSLFFSDLQTLINGHKDIREKSVLKKQGPIVQMDVQKNKDDPKRWYSVQLMLAYEIPGRDGVERYVATTLKDRAVPTWHRSFAAQEQRLVDELDQVDGGCRNQCLDMMKFICGKRPRFRILSAYHMKTLLLHECKEKPEAQMWRPTSLGVRVIDLMDRLGKALGTKSLPHYFIAEENLMESLPDQNRKGLSNRCKELCTKQDAFKAFVGMKK